MNARIIHHVEYLALTLILVGAALWQRGALGTWFWILLVLPDLIGFGPTMFMRRPERRGALPPVAVPFYNVAHTFTVPMAAWIAILLLAQGDPWPLLGWLIHIAVDRTLGFGLRAADGTQALI